VKVAFGGEVAIHRPLADACTFGHRPERQVAPVPAVEGVHEFAARGDDPLAGLAGLLGPRAVVVPAAAFC
jgi:hypothetical protein